MMKKMTKTTQHAATSSAPTAINGELEVDNVSAEELSEELDNVSGGYAPRWRYMDLKSYKVK